METTKQAAVVGVFDSQSDAQRAVQELKRMGFRDDEIGVAHKKDSTDPGETESGESYASTGALAGVATGAGVGALWGIGIAAGMLPAIGPVIAGGTLAAILASAATGAAAAGIVGALVGMGISEDEAKDYESELHSGRTVVTVKGSRANEARMVLDRFNGFDMQRRNESKTAAACSTGTATSAERGKTAQSGDKQKIQLREEELHVTKHPVQVGEVQVRKEVHTEQRTIQVPVKREEIVVERHTATGQGGSGEIGRNEEIRIPVREEQVQVNKEAVVKEEVTVGKQQVESTKEVADTVRKEDVRIEKKGNVNLKDTEGRGKK